MGLLEKQSQRSDSDNAGRMRLRGSPFTSTGEETPASCSGRNQGFYSWEQRAGYTSSAEVERERERESVCLCVRVCVCLSASIRLLGKKKAG